MSRTRTLTNMIADCRQRANMVNSTFVSDAEITEFLNQELAELYNAFLQCEDHPYFRSTQTISVTTSSNTASLNSTFLRIQEVEALINGVQGILHPFEPAERGMLVNAGLQGVSRYAHDVMYRLQGQTIEFLPVSQSFTAYVYYTPCQTRLSSGSDTFDGYNGYEVAAINGTVATMLAKEDSDPSFWLGQKDRLYVEIRQWAAARDVSHAPRVQEIITMSDY